MKRYLLAAAAALTVGTAHAANRGDAFVDMAIARASACTLKNMLLVTQADIPPAPTIAEQIKHALGYDEVLDAQAGVYSADRWNVAYYADTYFHVPAKQTLALLHRYDNSPDRIRQNIDAMITLYTTQAVNC